MTKNEAIQEINKAFEPAFANYIITALTESTTVSDKSENAVSKQAIIQWTLEEGIKHCEEIADTCEFEASKYDTSDSYESYVAGQEGECAEQHRQLAEWLKELKQLREQTRWIPISERLPKPQKDGDDKDFSDWVQVSIKINADQSIVCSAYYCFSEKKWYMKRLCCGEVVAWMQLPSSYQG